MTSSSTTSTSLALMYSPSTHPSPHHQQQQQIPTTMMQQAAAIPYVYTEFLPTRPSASFSESSASISALSSRPSAATDVQRLARENAVVVFGKRGCCMVHVIRLLLLCLGVNPLVHEVGKESAVVKELESFRKNGGTKGEVQSPAVFIGGKHFGGLDTVMATHITGELVLLLKEAGALWL